MSSYIFTFLLFLFLTRGSWPHGKSTGLEVGGLEFKMQFAAFLKISDFLRALALFSGRWDWKVVGKEPIVWSTRHVCA